jgi:cbb3-type cytochrome oxidase subunit 3
MLGYDLVTLLRIGSMLVFVTAFAGILVWMIWPGVKHRADEAAMIPLRDDRPPENRL